MAGKFYELMAAIIRLGKEHQRTTVPIHGNKDLGKGLISAIEKQTGVKFK